MMCSLCTRFPLPVYAVVWTANLYSAREQSFIALVIRYKITGRKEAGDYSNPPGQVQFRFSANHGRAVIFDDQLHHKAEICIIRIAHDADVWYDGGKYISIEMMIEKSKETYYEALRASSAGWLDGGNNPKPFVRYFLGRLLKCYRTFEERVTDVIGTRMSKPDRIRNAIDRTVGKFTKAQLLETCPDISETTIERTLKQFLDSGFIRKIGAGRGSAYCKA